MEKTLMILGMAREIVSETPDFHAVKGPGKGDRATNDLMHRLRKRVLEAFDEDLSEKKLSGGNALAVDFYLPSEATIVEVALGLSNPNSEFEKDILKALMAKEAGHAVDRLFFISRPGASKKCTQPGRAAMREWAESLHGLRIEVHELGGEPRKRIRKGKV